MDTIVSHQALRALMERVFAREGFTAEDAGKIADVLMQADLFGIESHGAQRMMYYHRNIAMGSVDVHAKPEILRETPVSALMDAHFAMGQLSGVQAMELAIEKAGRTGVGIVCVRNSSHYGIAGYYPLMAARQGLCAFSMTNTGPIMVPTFGREMMLGGPHPDAGRILRRRAGDEPLDPGGRAGRHFAAGRRGRDAQRPQGLRAGDHGGGADGRAGAGPALPGDAGRARRSHLSLLPRV